jgi:hypothetical protein
MIAKYELYASNLTKMMELLKLCKHSKASRPHGFVGPEEECQSGRSQLKSNWSKSDSKDNY